MDSYDQPVKQGFLLKLSKNIRENVNSFSHVCLHESLHLYYKIDGSHQIINNDKFFFLRFGYTQEADIADIDILLANALAKGDMNKPGEINGFFSLLFFNKINGQLTIHSDRVGINKFFYKNMNKEMLLASKFSYLHTDDDFEVDYAWLCEIRHFRTSSGSSTLSSTIKQLPAGQYGIIDDSLVVKFQKYYWLVCDRTPNDALTMEVACNESLKLLKQNLVKCDIKNKRVAVLLSGGVDSSLLTALAQEENAEVVAITPFFAEGENPELQIAKDFAQQLNIEHLVYEITEQDIDKAFLKVIALIGQPIRSPHSLILSIIVDRMNGQFDSVIFGEGADTMFGYQGIKTSGIRFQKQQKILFLRPFLPLLKPFNFISRINKVTTLLEKSISKQVTDSWSLDYMEELENKLPSIKDVGAHIEILSWLKLNEYDLNTISKEKLENLVRLFLIQVGNVDHFYTMGAITNEYGIELVCPFLDLDVVNFATTLPDSLYFGQGFVKPVLRELGAKYYDRKYMYLEKKGFPVPHKKWLANPLLTQANQASLILGNKFGKEALNDIELVWLAIALQELNILESIDKKM